MKTPPIIALAGLDGAGKSTQIEALRKRFGDMGLRVKVQHQFDTEIGKVCRELLRLTPNSYIRAITFALDKYASDLTNTAALDYDLVLCDRSYYCAIAYSGAQGIDEGWIRSLYNYSIPYTLCLYLDISPTTSYSRKGFDDKSPNIDERQFANVRTNYLDLVAKGALIRIDAEQEFDKVTNDIEKTILEVLRKCL